MTLALASLAASASAAIALCSCTGSRTSFLQMMMMMVMMMMMLSSHLNSLNLDAPRIGCFVQRRLHPVGDLLPEHSFQLLVYSTMLKTAPHLPCNVIKGKGEANTRRRRHWYLSDRISARHLVPSTFLAIRSNDHFSLWLHHLSVVAPKRRVEWLKSSTLFVAWLPDSSCILIRIMMMVCCK